MASSNFAQGGFQSMILTLESTLEVARRQLLEDPPHRENPAFDLDDFVFNFSRAAKNISDEATKFSMAFDGGGTVPTEACRCLVDKIETSCLALLAVFVTLPKSKGKILYKKYRDYVADTLQRIVNLCAAIRNQRPSWLKLIGDIWEYCEAAQRLPKDNIAAVAALFREQYGMVADASEELIESLENENPSFEITFVPRPPPNGIQIPSVQTWSNSDRNVLLPCSGLVKAAKACINKSMQAIQENGDGTNEGTINELDLIAEIVKDSSALADDFVSTLYPPMNHSAVREQASLLRNHSKSLLNHVKNSHFCSQSDEAWVEFLEKAVDHNWVRINDMVLAD